jgi:hypothetical protein
MRLSERALLVDLDIGVWSARATDKEVSEKARDDHHADTTAGSFSKNLLARQALKAINKAVSQATSAHRAMTLPWANNGSRIIKAEAYEKYALEMRVRKAEFEQAVEAFLKQYRRYVRQAQEFLGDMFKAKDYPSVETIRAKFYMKIEIWPVPESGDFRAKIGNKEVAILVKDLERRNAERMQAAVVTVYERITEVTEKMFSRLEEYKPSPGPYQESAEGIFRDTLVTNISELAELIPVLNITNDPTLEKLRERMVNDLTAYSAAELRKDAQARQRTARKAREIFDRASAFVA